MPDLREAEEHLDEG